MDISPIEEWFREYAAAYISDAHGRIRRSMQMKYAHSRRVAKRCATIAAALGWSGDHVAAARILGLLHDVSRFAQLAEHGTLLDARSFDHGERGWQILRAEPVPWPPGRWQSVVLAGVRYHNKRDVPDGVKGAALRFLHLIRDADKSDILIVLARAIRDRRFSDYPETFGALADDGCPAPRVLSCVEARRSVDYSAMRSVADLQLLLLGWIREFRYAPALDLVKRDGFFRAMAEGLPQDSRMRAVLDSVESFALPRGVGSI